MANPNATHTPGKGGFQPGQSGNRAVESAGGLCQAEARRYTNEALRTLRA